MKVEKKDDFSRILPKGTFLSDYALNPGGFPQIFHFSPDQADEKIASLQNQPFSHRDRESLVEYLRDYHRNLGAPPETLRAIDELNDPQALVIMTGQQPGLLTGPLYTIYKTISCLWEAERIRHKFGHPCIPIFWIASEDHNLEEAASIFWPDPAESGGYDTLSIRPRRGHFKQPVGLLPLNPAGKELGSFMQKLESLLSRTGTIHSNYDTGSKPCFASEVKHIIHTTLHSTLAQTIPATLAEWFSRLMLTFFGEYGLVMFEPNDARVKRLAGPIREKILADPLALPLIVDQAGRDLERRGYRRQLSSYPDRCPFFLYEDEPKERMMRERVTWDGQLFRTRNQAYSPKQLQEIFRSQPERFSPNVYLRPALSEFLFPTLLYLAGPGEMGYFAQIKGVYEYFGLTMPILLPRFSATLHDARSDSSALPQDAYPQERKLNIFYLLNLYGPDFIKALHALKVRDYFFHYHIEIAIESR